ncbi:MAG: hypothetical protein SGI97_02745 [candidate division Zixibacteria bacterium]|nr:hypothetical protein [candidate division Zixibacteria bacterium]
MNRKYPPIIILILIGCFNSGCDVGSKKDTKEGSTGAGHPEELKDSTRLDPADESAQQKNAAESDGTEGTPVETVYIGGD